MTCQTDDATAAEESGWVVVKRELGEHLNDEAALLWLEETWPVIVRDAKDWSLEFPDLILGLG